MMPYGCRHRHSSLGTLQLSSSSAVPSANRLASRPTHSAQTERCVVASACTSSGRTRRCIITNSSSHKRAKRQVKTANATNHTRARSLISRRPRPYQLIMDTNAVLRVYFVNYNDWDDKPSPQLPMLVEVAERVIVPWFVLIEINWLQGGGSSSFPTLRVPRTGRELTAADIRSKLDKDGVEVLSPAAVSADVYRLNLQGRANNDPFDCSIASHAFELLQTYPNGYFVTSDRCLQKCRQLRTLW